MNRLFRSLLRLKVPRWVFVVAGVLLLALLIWFVGPLIAIAGVAPLRGWIVRLVVILLMVAGVAAWHAWRWRRAAKANEAMVRDLGAAQEPATVQEDLSAEDLKSIEDRAAKALDLMRTARVGKDRELVYELPWYIIIGPPGAGKTTALHNAGLNFPVAQELGAAPLKGIGGTRTCEWWFTDQAVLIDTAGRYTTQDSHEAADAKAWGGFLDLLKRYRPRQPVTGVIVAISITDLLGADEGEVIAHGKAVRSRINEITQKFGVRTPVYLLITKADLLAGFAEFFDDATQEDREQVWGHTFPLVVSRDADAPVRATAAAFDALGARLNDRLLARVQAEQDMQRRGLIFGFPQQFAALRQPLSTLMQIVGRETRFEPTPLVRGFYFASGTQFGRPIDRLLGSLAAKFQIDAAPVGGEGPKGRSYFLHDLLSGVIFPEAALAGRDPAAERRRRRIRLAAVGGGAALVALVSVLWLVGYLANARLVHMLAERGEKLRQASAALPQGDVTDSDLLQILPVLDQARVLPFATTAPKDLRTAGFSFGVGRAAAFRPQVDGAYHNLLNRQMLPRLILTLEDRLRALTTGDSSQSNPAPSGAGGTGSGGARDNRAEIYNLLRIYLMLGRSPGAPMERDQIVAWFADAWADQYPGQEYDPVRADLQRHLESLVSSSITPPALDRDLIASARGRVTGLSPGERVYARLVEEPALREQPGYALVNVPGVGTSGLFARKSGKSLALGVPGMFRRGAFYSVVMPAIAKAATQSASEAWVTGEQKTAGSPLSEAGRIKDGILVAYLNDFTRQWDDFIGDLGISGQYPPNERVHRAIQPPSPVKQLMSSLADETNLTPPALPTQSGPAAAFLRTASLFSRSIYRGVSRMDQVAGMNASVPAGPPGPLDEVIEHYRWLRELNPASGPSPIDTALEALKATDDSSTAAKAAASMGDPVLQHDRTSSAMAAASKLKDVTASLPPAAGGLFTGFVTASTTQLNTGAHESIQKQYEAQLLPECKSIVAQGFPFAAVEHQVSIDDFSRLFRPSGLIDQFQTANLTGQIDTSKSGWGLSQSGRALGLQLGAIGEFEKADLIRRAFFKPGDIRPNVRFLLEPVSMTGGATATTLTVDGTPASFEAANHRAVELRWPGSSPGVTLSFQGPAGSQPSVRTWAGDWAFLRMLQDATVTKATASGMTVQLTTGPYQAVFSLRLVNTSNPFLLPQLRTFQCPATL